MLLAAERMTLLQANHGLTDTAPTHAHGSCATTAPLKDFPRLSSLSNQGMTLACPAMVEGYLPPRTPP